MNNLKHMTILKHVYKNEKHTKKNAKCVVQTCGKPLMKITCSEGQPGYTSHPG